MPRLTIYSTAFLCIGAMDVKTHKHIDDSFAKAAVTKYRRLNS